MADVSLTLTVLPVASVWPLKLRTVAFGGISSAGAPRLAAPHHSPQNRPLAEVFQLLEFALELFKASPILFQHRYLRGRWGLGHIPGPSIGFGMLLR